MNQAEAAHSLLLELQRLRREGLREVYVEEDSLLALEKVLQEKFGRSEPAKPDVITPKESPLRFRIRAELRKPKKNRAAIRLSPRYALFRKMIFPRSPILPNSICPMVPKRNGGGGYGKKSRPVRPACPNSTPTARLSLAPAT